MMLCQPPLLYVQVSLVKHRAASLFVGRCFLGFIFCGLNTIQQPRSRQYVAAPPIYLWLERTASGDRAHLARKQTSRDATRACVE